MKTRPTIGVIGAMDSEIAHLVGRLENKSETGLYGYTFHTGTLHGRWVVIVKCGIGKVNAARGTQLLIDRYHPDAVVNTGIAGGLDPALQVGDAVIAAGLLQHDFDVTAFGHARGYLCTGIAHDKPTVFAPDPGLAAALRRAAENTLTGARVTEGLIATGDLFVADPATRRAIREEFGASAAEMEGAAIAQTASYAGVPFAVLRIVSDRADGSAAESFDRFEAETAQRSGAVIEAFLQEY